MLQDTVETVVTYLEMTAPRFVHAPAPATQKIMLLRLEKPTVGYYRYLYDAVGRNFTWVDRKAIGDGELAVILATPDVEVWVLYAGGVPAGYFELDATGKEVVDISYFGVVPHFHGRGLGKWLLAEAIKASWSHNPQRVTVNTCTLDGPRALPLYQKMGFVPMRQVAKTVVLPPDQSSGSRNHAAS